MKNYLTADYIANTARMIRTSHHGAILIVEGTIDVRVYENFINKAQCKIIPAINKDLAIAAINKLEIDTFRGILTIVDTDFWKLDGINAKSLNILLTDTHDLETMILFSEAFDKVLSEFGAKSKIASLGRSIRDILLDAALPIGLLRWLSSPTKDNLFLKFNGIKFNNFIDIKDLSVNIDNLIKEVKNNSRGSTLDVSAIRLKIITLIKARYDPWQVCNGHDLIQLLAIGLTNIFGNHRTTNITLDAVDGILRVSYEYSYFRSTQLHDAIKNWENVNSPFKVLA